MEDISKNRIPLFLKNRMPHGKLLEEKAGKIVIIFACAVLFYITAFRAPALFVPDSVVQIQKGMNLHDISELLKEQNIIRSRIAFEAFVILYGGEKNIMSSDYLFEDKLPVFEVARRIASGEHHSAPLVVTIPEGFDIRQASEAFSAKLKDFDKENFLTLASAKEGYLFPDTYYFFSADNEQTVISSMLKNFDKKIKPLLPEITASGKKEAEIITMASVIEREAKGNNDREIISGILWKRLRIGMPLQVDAAPLTYETRGLPPSPISNPGLASIKAAIHPQDSIYLYYIHDKNGNIYYARTFSEHRENIKKYLTN